MRNDASPTVNGGNPVPDGVSPAAEGASRTARGADSAISGAKMRGARALRAFDRAFWTLLGIAVLISVWAYAASTQKEYVLPGPDETWAAIRKILATDEFWEALRMTLVRALVGLFAALVVGVAWGCAMGKWKRVGWFFQPGLYVLLSTPAIVFVILGMVWFGTAGDLVVIFVVGIVTAPVLAAASAQAVRDVDRDLIEMARVFRLPKRVIVRRVEIPMIAPPVLAAATVALGQSIRVCVMAELLATATGMGGAVRMAQNNIDTPEIFAYAVAMAAVAFLLEASLVSPLRKRAGKSGRGET